MDDDDSAPSSGLAAAIPSILWQRKWWMVIPLVLAVIAGGIACYVISPIYKSEATVLIEAQDLPDSLVDTNVSDAVDQRIARARQRVLSRMELIRLIRAYSLYAKEQRKTPLSKVVDMMKSNTTIAAVNTGGAASAARRILRGSSTIALTISFQYSDPVQAQVIAQQYVNRFLEFDASSQADQAIGAANFLQDQANDLQAKVAAVESQITRIKTENGAILALGQQSTGDITGDVARIDTDILRLETENASLAATPAQSRDVAGVGAAENALRIAQAKYSDSHPDVIAARSQLDAARRAAAALPASDPGAGHLAANRVQIASLQNAKMLLMSRSGAAHDAQARAPALAAQVDQLEKQADQFRNQYQQIAARLQTAQISAKMEAEQKGERLTLADPPVVPDRPIKPNRPVIMAVAVVGGLGLGLAMIFLIEFLFRPMRGPMAVTSVFGEPPLAVVADLNHKPSLIVRMLEKRMRARMARV